MPKISQLFWVALTTVWLLGCTAPFEPRLVPIGGDELAPVYSDTPVAVVNVQDRGVVKVKSDTEDKDSDLHVWSARAADLIGMWLRRYSVPVDPGAEKMLKVSIQEPRIHHPRNMPCTILTLKIETSSGLSKVFPVEGCAAGNARSAGYAISYGVIEMMKDKDIVEFIQSLKPGP